jgi:NAD(P)-dependent dehydrogenase (short-subunit alcohol dehydrogenase family)
VTALVMCHCESVASGLLDTTVESFDRHFAVNARAVWLLIREYATRFQGPAGTGRIISLTSDHTVRNLPYGASKGALDRITLAAAEELAHLGVSANVINPRAGRHRLDDRGDQAQRHPPDPARPARHARGHRAPGRLPVLARGAVDQRAAPEEQRRLLLA